MKTNRIILLALLPVVGLLTMAQISRPGGIASESTVDALFESLNALAGRDYVIGGATNENVVGLKQPVITGPVTKPSATYEGGTILADLAASGDFTFRITNATLEIGYASVPNTTGTVKTWSGIVTNAYTDIASVQWGDASATSKVPVTQLGTNDVYEFKLESRDNVLRYTYVGPQEQKIPPALGGTGTIHGQAVSPSGTVFVQSPATGTNYPVNFGYGTRMEDAVGSGVVNINTNIMFHESSGRPAAGLEKRVQAFVVNTNATGTNYIRPRSNWQTIGWPTNGLIELASSNTAWLEFVALNSTEDKVWAINRLATTTTLGGGGAEPAYYGPTNGMVAYYNFEATSGSTLTNSLGGSDLTLSELGGAWTKDKVVIHNKAWTNTVTSRILTNDHSSLRLGRSGASFTMTAWIHLTDTDTARLAGEMYEATGQYGWGLRLASGASRFQIQAHDGTSFIGLAHSNTSITAQRYFVACGLDNNGNVLRISVNGGNWETTAFSGNINDSSAGFSLGGYSLSTGALSSSRAGWDEVGVWSRALSQTEIEYLYNSGSGKFYNATSGVFE